jgi:Rrf2 family protein
MLYSSSCAYAVRALSRLASTGGETLVKLHELARDEEIPYPFLAKIFNDLISAGLVRAVRGPRGGYALTREPRAISLYDIRAAIDGIDDLERCVLGLAECPGEQAFGVLASPSDLFAGFAQIAVSVPNPLALPEPRLGAHLPQSVPHRRLVRLPVRAQRHAQLPAARVREERRRRPDRADVRLRRRPTSRQPGLVAVGSALLPEGDRARCAACTATAASRARSCARASSTGSTAGSRAIPSPAMPPPELTRRGWDSWVRVSHEEAYAYHARALENIAEHLLGRAGARAPAGAGLRRVDDRRARGRRHAHAEVPRRHGPARRRAPLRHLPDGQQHGAARPPYPRRRSPTEAKGGGAWDSYSFHTDLPPGHPMVSGEQTNDFELHDTENAGLIIAWGMNWITTKMPDSHWLTEARLKGARTVAVTVEYSATASKCDDVIVIRPGTDPAFALGLAQVIIEEKRYDESFVKRTPTCRRWCASTRSSGCARPTCSPSTGSRRSATGPACSRRAVGPAPASRTHVHSRHPGATWPTTSSGIGSSRARWPWAATW